MSLVGQPAPDFTLLDTARQPHTLSDLRGQKVVVVFFPAAFSGVCEKELCSFRDVLHDFDALDATILAVSVDGPFANKGFADKLGVSFPLLSDYTRATTQAYGVAWPDFAGLPGYTVANRSVFIVDEDGRVSWQWVAPNPGVEPDYAAVKAALR